MTPAAALSAMIARLQTVTGLDEARSPLGVRNASAARIDRSFSVRPGGLSLSDGGGRGRVDARGLRVAQRLRVELGHQLKPSAGAAAPVQALTDLHAALKAIHVPGTTLTEAGFVVIADISSEYVGSGAYIVHTIDIDLQYYLALV